MERTEKPKRELVVVEEAEIHSIEKKNTDVEEAKKQKKKYCFPNS